MSFYYLSLLRHKHVDVLTDKIQINPFINFLKQTDVLNVDNISINSFRLHLTTMDGVFVQIKQSIYLNFRQIEFKLRWLLGATKARMVGQCIFPRIMINFNLKVPPSGRKTSLLQREHANPQ